MVQYTYFEYVRCWRVGKIMKDGILRTYFHALGEGGRSRINELL